MSWCGGYDGFCGNTPAICRESRAVRAALPRIQVIKLIDNLVVTLGKEQTDDDAQRTWCNQESDCGVNRGRSREFEWPPIRLPKVRSFRASARKR